MVLNIFMINNYSFQFFYLNIHINYFIAYQLFSTEQYTFFALIFFLSFQIENFFDNIFQFLLFSIKYLLCHLNYHSVYIPLQYYFCILLDNNYFIFHLFIYIHLYIFNHFNIYLLFTYLYSNLFFNHMKFNLNYLYSYLITVNLYRFLDFQIF